MASRDEILRFVLETKGVGDVDALAASLDKVGHSGTAAKREIDPLLDELGRLVGQAKAVEEALNLERALAKNGSALAAAKKSLADLNDEFDRSDKSSTEVAQAFALAEKQVKTLSAEELKLQNAYARATGALKEAGVDTTKLATANETLRGKAAAVVGQITATATAAATASNRTEKLAAAFNAARDRVNTFASGLLRVTGIAGAVSSALGAISVGRLFSGAVSSATDFEAALSEVRAVSGATADQLKEMRDAAESASETTKFSATEAVGALGELARASGDAKAAIAQLPPTLNLAQAAGLGAAESANILTTTITQFGLAAGDAARVADLFAREANSTQDTVTSLGLAMSYVAPLAKQLGLNIEQTTALLGGLAEQGFRGERAGTALRNVFSALLDPSSSFRDELAKLNITGGDFQSIIEQLAAAGDKGKTALLSLDAAARPAIAALVQSGGAGIRRLTEDFQHAGGEAERTAKIMGENFEGASSRLRNAFDALRRSLIDPVLQPLAAQFDDVAKRVRAFADTDAFAKIKQSVLDFATQATAAIIKWAGSIDFDAVSAKISGFVDTAGGFFKQLGENTRTAGDIIGGTAETIRATFNSIQAIILGAAAVTTGAFVGLSKGALFAAEALSHLSGSYGGLKPVFDSVREKLNGLQAVAEEFARRAKDNAGDAGAAFSELGNRINGTTAAAKDGAAAMDALGGKLKLTTEQAIQLSQGFLDLPPSIQKVVEPALRAAGVFDLIAKAAAPATDAVAKTGEAAQDAAGKIDLSFKDLADKPLPPPDTSGLQQAFREVQEAGGEAAERAASDASRVREQQESMSGALGGALQALAQNMASFEQHSHAAALEYNRLVVALNEGAGTFSQQAIADGTGIIRFGEAVAQAVALTQAAIDRQKQGVENLAQSYANLSADSVADMVRMEGGSDRLVESLREQAREAAQGKSAFELLGAADLAPLQAALEAAAARVEQLTQQALQAKDAIASIGASIQDEIDRIRGNDKDIEDRRFREQLENLREQAEIAGTLGQAEYQEAVRRARELHRLKLEQIAEEKRAREEADRAGSSGGDKPSGGGGGGKGPGGGGGGGLTPSAAGSPITVNVTGFLPSDSATMDDFARRLRRELGRLGGLNF